MVQAGSERATGSTAGRAGRARDAAAERAIALGFATALGLWLVVASVLGMS